jgi:hypothetical protein
MLCTSLTRYQLDDQIKESEMGGARGTFGGEERCIEGLGGET